MRQNGLYNEEVIKFKIKRGCLHMSESRVMILSEYLVLHLSEWDF